MIKKNPGMILLLCVLSPAVLFLAKPEVRTHVKTFLKPSALKIYLTEPAMRDLIYLIAEHRLLSFMTVWDTDQGVLLSKKIFEPVEMEGKRRYRYLPHLKKLSFMTGTSQFQRKFEAQDTPRLRGILSKLKTSWAVESSFDENGFRKTRNPASPSCRQAVFFAGDSFTEGLWVKDEETFASLYSDKLKETAEDDSCVINSGTNGYGLWEESFVIRQSFLKYPLKTVFVVHYPNDIHADAFAVLRGEIPGLDQLWKDHFAILENLKVFADKKNIRLILVPIPPKEQFAMPETRRNYQDRLKAFCRENHIEFWDPFEFLEKHTWDEIYLDWDPHFNASGHRLLAQFLWGKALTSAKAEL